jgi:hypothetical protein
MDENEMINYNKATENIHDTEAKLSKQNLTLMNEIEGELDYEDEFDEPDEGIFPQMFTHLDDKSEIKDKVDVLPALTSPSKLVKSKHSSRYAFELKSAIEDERKDRLRIQKELDELKQKLTQLLPKDN